ncbi:MAG: IPT/TIG domain-containing protein [Candidatus Acidiferrales bacterium]|jgi:hypothetical protein
MLNVPASGFLQGKIRSSSIVQTLTAYFFGTNGRRSRLLVAAAILLSPLAFAQNAAQVTSVDPSSGKVNDTITLAGDNLGKGSVSAVFLSDDKDDYKATIVDQSADKIVAKVPQVKAGDYNVSIQVGDKLYIKPVKFKVEQ